MSVKTEADEAVIFSWIEWPDKPTRDRAHARIGAMMSGVEPLDERLDPAHNPMPFDGRRMIFGGFMPVVDLR